MSTTSRIVAAALVLISAALFCARLWAATMTPQIGGGISQFDGGVGTLAGGGGAVASCPSPTAPNGVVDLSLCSNSFYVAVILF